MTVTSSEYQLKLALLQELEQALKWKREYETLTQELAGLLVELVRYSRENNINLHNDEKLRRTMYKIAYIIKTTDGSYHPEDSDGELPVPPKGHVTARSRGFKVHRGIFKDSALALNRA